MASLREKCWIWGHEEGAHNTGWNIPAPSRMTPTEGAYYLGIPNMMMVCYAGKPEPPFDRESIAFDSLDRVIWSVVGDSACGEDADGLGHTEEILRLAKIHPNIVGGVFDDFFSPKRTAVYTPQRLEEIRRRFHEAGLEIWVVLYDHQLNDPAVKAHMPYVDGITYWTWKGCDLDRYDENFDRLRTLYPDKQVLLGCYVYNYGEHMEMTVEQMQLQLPRYARLVKEGRAEGIIFLSNTVMDLGLEAVEYTREYLRLHGDDAV